MKVLIVDDEEHVREGVELSIDWAAYQIHEILMAEDGWNAIEIVRRENPELIICDMSMPRMDGPSFLQLLRQEGWNSKVIVLSGYEEFRYTRATLLANGVDYLLKPFKINDLDKVVDKAIASIQQSKHSRTEEIHRNYRLKEADSLINEQRIGSYLQYDPIPEDSMLQLFKEVGLNEGPFYTLVYLPTNSNDVIENHYKGDESLFNFSVKNVLRDIVHHLGPYYCFSYESFLVVWIQTDVTRQELEFYARKISDLWEQALHLRTITGVCSLPAMIRQLHYCLNEAKAEILNTPIARPSRPTAMQQSKEPARFIDNEILLLEAIRNQDKNQIQQLVHLFVEDLRLKQDLTLKELQHYSVEVNLLLMRIYSQLQQEHPIEAMPLWLSDLQEWEHTLVCIFHNIIDNSNEQAGSTSSLSAIKNYIADHIHQDLTLTLLAEKFHFSPQYLSKRFKEMYHTTVMNYITQLRMEKASSLLKLSELSVQEIAEAVGYEDDNYFGKVFRKHYGMAPTQYRKTYKA